MFEKLITGFTGVPLSVPQRRILVGILLAGLALRLLLMGTAHYQGGLQQTFEGSFDSKLYLNMAKGIVDGTGGNESGFFYFGPGYAYFLAFNILLLGSGLVQLILVNIILSTLSCLLVFLLSQLITRSVATSLTACALAAFSYNAITLSCLIMSDVTYFFVFLLGLVLYIKALTDGRWKWFIISGVVTGLAVLVRPVGQFWPLAMIVLAALSSFRPNREFFSYAYGRYELIGKSSTAIVIVLAIMSLWIIRNHNVHGVAAVAFSSANGPAHIAALTIGQERGVKHGQVWAEWIEDYKDTTGQSAVTLGETFRIYASKAPELIDSLGWKAYRTYLTILWNNLNDIAYGHRTLLPSLRYYSIKSDNWFRRNNLNYIVFGLSMLGFVLLFLKRQYRLAVILGCVYFYYVPMIGFYRWQGARYFYPGQIAWTIMIAVVFVFFGRAADRWFDLRLKGMAIWSRLSKATDSLRTTIASYDPEHSRYYFPLYAIVTFIGVVILFRKFIFTDLMLCGGSDTLAAGVFFRSLLLDHWSSYKSIPMWNPYILAGLPYVDAFHSDIFYPFSIAKFFGPLHRMVGYTLIAHVYCSGIFMYLTAREFGISKIASTFSGVSYMFASWLISLVAPGHDGKLFVASLFPLLILFVNKAFRTRPVLYFTLAGAVIGCMILSPHPQMSYYSLLALAMFGLYKLYCRYRTQKSYKPLIPPSAGLIGVVILGLTISAIQFYPSYVYTMNDSPRAGPSQGGDWAAGWSIHNEELFSLVVPEFCGTDSWAEPELEYWGINWAKDNSEYVGTIPLFLAFLGLFFFRRKGTLFWGSLAGATLIYSLGDTTHLFKLFLRLIPLLSKVRAPSMSMFLFSFSVAILSGFFVQALLDSKVRTLRKLPWAFTKVLWGIPIIVSAVGLLYYLAGEETLRLYARMFYPWLLSDHKQAPGKLEEAINYLPFIKSGFVYASLLLWSAALLIWTFIKRSYSPLVLMILPLLVICNSLRFNSRFVNVMDYDEEFKPGRAVEFLQERDDDDRVYGYDLNLNQYHLYDHGISMSLGYHGNQLLWYTDLYNYGGRWSHSCAKPRFVNLLNVGYILYPSRGELALDRLGPIPLDTAAVFENEVVFRNHNRFPRVYLVGQYEVIPDRHEIYPLVLDGDANLRELVYLEEEPELEIAGSIDDSATAEIEYYGLDSIRIEVNCSTNQMLCMSDNWYNAWHAYVDGKESKVYRAYGSFRAVEIPAGSKEVVFKYDSPIYRRGRALSILGTTILFGILGYYGFGYVRRRRGARTV